MPERSASEATVKCRVQMDAVVIRGPSGIHGKPGSREHLETQTDKIVEVTYEQAVEMFGQENADRLFIGAREDVTNEST